jgi:predicted transcriptional regulator
MARTVNLKGSSNPESPGAPTAGQIRAARALLDWSQKDLAEKSKLSVPTIKRMEGAMGPGRSTSANVDAVLRALKSAGIVFLASSDRTDGGPGVRLKK